jgi:hypothetical protein
VNPTSTDFFAHDCIAELMRVSSDIHPGPEGGGSASRLSAALAGPTRWIRARRTAAASAAATVIPRRLAGRP